MSTLSPETVQRQIIGLNTLRKEADALGNLIADEAWDSFEHELEDLTGDGIHWELADYLSSSLPMQLGVAFDERCEHWLGQRLDSLSKQLPQGIDAPDTGHDFYSILKGQRLSQRFAPQFANLFERSKPGIFSLLARSLIDDVEYAVNHMEKDSLKDAQRLRQNFYNARSQFVGEMSQAAAALIHKACQNYAQSLREMQNTSTAA